ncbi:MAG: site-specific recombinase [Acidimicrobiaceae bacterium]|nr:site-specific recombinase [Acidimicrobiaceae bacterium]
MKSFTDQKSGATTDRPGLQRAIGEAKAKRFDLLLVYRVDRFARSVRGLAHLLEELDKAGVAFRSATEPFDTTTPAGRMTVQMLGVFAEFERATIVDRIVAGLERKAARGEWPVGSAPFGYVRGDDGNLVVHEDQAALIPLIFDLYVKRRLGGHGVADWLNANGHRNSGGRLWTYTNVIRILRNRVYVGEVNWRDQWHQGKHPSLVAKDVFDAAQSIRSERAYNSRRLGANSSPYLLSGLVVCANCGAHLVGGVANGRAGYQYRYYTCGTKVRYGSKVCATDRVPSEELDRQVVDSLLRTYERTDLFERAIEAIRRRADEVREQQRKELTAVDTELAKTEAGIERYMDSFESGGLKEDTLIKRIRDLGERAADLRNRRAAIAQALEDAEARDGDGDGDFAVPDAKTKKAPHNPCPHRTHEGRVAGTQGAHAGAHRRDQGHEPPAIVPTFRVPTGSTGPKLVRALAQTAPWAGLEPATIGLEVRCSIHLSYQGTTIQGRRRAISLYADVSSNTRVVISNGCRSSESAPSTRGNGVRLRSNRSVTAADANGKTVDSVARVRLPHAS